MKRINTTWLACLGCGLIFVMLCASSSMEFEEVKAFEKRYCEMVEIGAWGDYRPEIDCEKVKG